MQPFKLLFQPARHGRPLLKHSILPRQFPKEQQCSLYDLQHYYKVHRNYIYSVDSSSIFKYDNLDYRLTVCAGYEPKIANKFERQTASLFFGLRYFDEILKQVRTEVHWSTKNV